MGQAHHIHTLTVRLSRFRGLLRLSGLGWFGRLCGFRGLGWLDRANRFNRLDGAYGLD
jgi:hypothetical protein